MRLILPLILVLIALLSRLCTHQTKLSANNKRPCYSRLFILFLWVQQTLYLRFFFFIGSQKVLIFFYIIQLCRSRSTEGISLRRNREGLRSFHAFSSLLLKMYVTCLAFIVIFRTLSSLLPFFVLNKVAIRRNFLFKHSQQVSLVENNEKTQEALLRAFLFLDQGRTRRSHILNLLH